MLNNSVSEYINVGAGVSGGFTNTNELHMKKYQKAINGPDGKKWKDEVKMEHGRILKVMFLRKSNLVNFLVR
jgi:hypothetical protein